MQNYVSFCLKIAPEGEKNFEKKSPFFYMNFQKNYAQIIEHIQLPPTPSI
jgi:hypothetical protein